MTALAQASAANAALTQVAQQGLARVDFQVVSQAALAVWHGQDGVDLQAVHGPFLSDAVSLLERLCFYSVAPQERRKALLTQVLRVREALGLPTDPHAFQAAFLKFLPGLQSLQTRHHAAA